MVTSFTSDRVPRMKGIGVPGAGRTRNHQIRSLLLCPLSYGDGRAKLYSNMPLALALAVYRLGSLLRDTILPASARFRVPPTYAQVTGVSPIAKQAARLRIRAVAVQALLRSLLLMIDADYMQPEIFINGGIPPCF